ncbi:MAG: hypothetical protein ACRCYS_00985, partial [Beijerinckiaceae bacterium]
MSRKSLPGMDMRVTFKIALLGLAALIGMIVNAALSQYGQNVQERHASEAGAALALSAAQGELATTLFQIRAIDFDGGRPRAVDAKEQRRAVMDAAEAALQRFKTHLTHNQHAVMAGDASRLAQLMAAYHAATQQSAEMREQIGHEDGDGLARNLRLAADALDAVLRRNDHAPLRILFLRLRQHEKTFALRQDSESITAMGRDHDGLTAT